MAFPTSPTNGQIYKNYIYNSNKWEFKASLDGSSPRNAAPSGYYLKNKYPTKPSGWYWIQSQFMPNPLQMYVDMTEEGGGYDFYAIQNGISINYITEPHSGTPLGLDLMMPRSQACLKAMYNFIVNITGGTIANYAKILPVYRNIGAVGAAGSYVSYYMNSLNAPHWRVKDGGRWWLRDTVFTEPNGDYTYNAFLCVSMTGYAINPDGSLTGFNDYDTTVSAASYTGTGGYYIVSTNSKP